MIAKIAKTCGEALLKFLLKPSSGESDLPLGIHYPPPPTLF